MKVFISNVTGSSKKEAMLDKDSGVIEFSCGTISHTLFELQKGNTIEVLEKSEHYKAELAKQKAKLEEEEKVKEAAKKEEVRASEEHSKKSKVKKSKA